MSTHLPYSGAQAPPRSCVQALQSTGTQSGGRGQGPHPARTLGPCQACVMHVWPSWLSPTSKRTMQLGAGHTKVPPTGSRVKQERTAGEWTPRCETPMTGPASQCCWTPQMAAASQAVPSRSTQLLSPAQAPSPASSQAGKGPQRQLGLVQSGPAAPRGPGASACSPPTLATAEPQGHHLCRGGGPKAPGRVVARVRCGPGGKGPVSHTTSAPWLRALDTQVCPLLSQGVGTACPGS